MLLTTLDPFYNKLKFLLTDAKKHSHASIQPYFLKSDRELRFRCIQEEEKKSQPGRLERSLGLGVLQKYAKKEARRECH